MPIQHAIWQVGQQTAPRINGKLASEALLEDMIVRDQNAGCQPTTPKWRHTVERLKAVFNIAA